MPINEILAPSYARVKWSSPVASHNSILYFGSSASEIVLGSVTEFAVVGRDGASASISAIIGTLYSRARQANQTPVVSIDEILVFNSAAGVNTFVGTAENPTLSGTVGSYIASAYGMFVFASANRQKTRFTAFEYPDAKPQRTAGIVVPLVDDGTVQWYFIRGNAPFTTQDGFPVVAFKSFNTGYNRKLARSYGRVIAP